LLKFPKFGEEAWELVVNPGRIFRHCVVELILRHSDGDDYSEDLRFG